MAPEIGSAVAEPRRVLRRAGRTTDTIAEYAIVGRLIKLSKVAGGGVRMVRTGLFVSTVLVWLALPVTESGVFGQSAAPARTSVSSGAGSGLGGVVGASGSGRSMTIYGGQPGASPGRYQPALTSPPAPYAQRSLEVQLPEPLPARKVVQPKATQPGLTEPTDQPWIGDESTGIRIEEALDRLCRDNLELRAKASDISQAEADTLTASLRSNPILYADRAQAPYGNFTKMSSAGPLQYDVNVVYPIDWSRKRLARTRVADLARAAVQASYRDAVRLTIDNLYQAYVDALLAQSNYDVTRPPDGTKPVDLTASISVDEPESAQTQTQRALALLLNMPPSEIERRRLYGRLAFREDKEEVLPAVVELVARARATRPDVVAARLVTEVAEANVRAMRTNRFEDVLLLYQPYTATDGRPFGLNNSVAWTVGVTIPLPIFNRQQGNIRKAELAAEQAQTRLLSVQNTADSEVQAAVLEHKTAHQAIKRTYHDYIKALRIREKGAPALPPLNPSLNQEVRDAINEMRGALDDSWKIIDALKEDNYDDKGRQFKEAMVRHRRSMLRLNTAVGERIMP
jgi:outer membrane protein, heavy metal efflux system